MNGSPIRFALVGTPGSITKQSQTVERMREAVVVVKSESMEAALQSGIDFDAAIVACIKDARHAAESGKHNWLRFLADAAGFLRKR